MWQSYLDSGPVPWQGRVRDGLVTEGCDPSEWEQQLLTLLNHIRYDSAWLPGRVVPAHRGLIPPLVFDARLLHAARERAEYMRDERRLNPPMGTGARLLAHGLHLASWAESLTAGPVAPDELLTRLLCNGHPEHRRHLLGQGTFYGRHRAVGIGAAVADDGTSSCVVVDTAAFT
jgi:hypothetical protein